MATEQAEKTKLELSCREANLILRVIPLRKNVKEMKEEEIAAINHYLQCKSCRDRGLADILDTKLSCREAVLVWAEQARSLWLSCNPGGIYVDMETLIENYAVEHVWGKYQWQNSIGGHGWNTLTACRERPCRALHSYWARVPMSSGAGDGPEGVIHLFPFLFDVFLKENWPLDEFFAVQKGRVMAVLDDVKNGKVTVSSGNYHFVYELLAEVQAHVEALQKLAVRS